jgi:hypothetical protein
MVFAPRSSRLILGLLALSVATAHSAGAAITTVDLNSQTAAQVAQTLVGPGVSISNVTFTGGSIAGGTSQAGRASLDSTPA